MQNIISLIFRYFLSLFPACAGVIPLFATRPENLRAFPRMCGGDPNEFSKKSKIINFSPHVRG